jgi:hypothetical protein
VKTQAFATFFRSAATVALLVFAISGPVAHAQTARGDSLAPRAAVDRNFLIGSWSDSGDCSTTVAFMADGGYATADGAEGRWSLTGETLTLSGEAGATTLTIIPIDRDTMEVIGEDGSHDRSTRCAGDLGNVHIEENRVA